MTSGSSPHWLAAPLQTANPNAKIHWRGRAGLSQQPTSSCFLLGVQKDLYFWSCYKGFNCNTYFCQVATDTFIFWVFFPSLLTSRNEVNLARIEKLFLTSLPAYFFFIFTVVYCVLSPTDMVSRHVSVLQADPVSDFASKDLSRPRSSQNPTAMCYL